MSVFDYKWVTKDTEQEYQALLAMHADAFRAWTAKNRADKGESLERSFQLWWLFKGPTGFKRDQSVRFKRELLAAIEAGATVPAPASEVEERLITSMEQAVEIAEAPPGEPT